MTFRLPRPLLAVPLLLALIACTPAAAPDQVVESSRPVAGGSASVPGKLPGDVSYATSTEGVEAPSVDLHLVDGTTLSVGDYEDRPVVLVFFTTWCQWCTDKQTALNELAAEHGDTALFVGVSGTDSPEVASAYASDHSLPYPVALDPDLTVHRAFAVEEPPLVAVIAPGGNLVRGWPGGVPVDTLADLLAGFSGSQG